jgi:hypothetical protein
VVLSHADRSRCARLADRMVVQSQRYSWLSWAQQKTEQRAINLIRFAQGCSVHANVAGCVAQVECRLRDRTAKLLYIKCAPVWFHAKKRTTSLLLKLTYTMSWKCRLEDTVEHLSQVGKADDLGHALEGVFDISLRVVRKVHEQRDDSPPECQPSHNRRGVCSKVWCHSCQVLATGV